MKGKKATKRALLSSALSLVLCFSMLLGTTFAWFTDEAKTGVNTIQAGTLDIMLMGQADDGTYSYDLEGQDFQFKNFNDSPDILWEPGVTFKTDGFQIQNHGDLWLKYQLVINGVTDGNAKLLEAIDFYMTTVEPEDDDTAATYMTAVEAGKTDGRTFALNDFVSKFRVLAPMGKPGSIGNDPTTYDDYDGTYYLVGHMKEEAGNEYQGLSIEGVGITVYATQMEAEFDSFDNTYDAAAAVSVSTVDALKAAIAAADDGSIVFVEPGVYTIGSVITISGKSLSIIGLGNVELKYAATGGSHFFNVANGSDVTFENLTMTNAAKHGIYVRNNSVATLKNVSISGSRGSADIMVDEGSDAAHGLNTASYVHLFNSDVERVALCASPVTSVAATQDTYVYFNYDADSTVGSIEKQNINKKPENIFINGVNDGENAITLYVTNDAELAAALETIKTNKDYWNKQVYVSLAAGEYSADHVINQYPEWNGIVGRGTGNNYQGGVPAGAPLANVTFVGETASTYSLRGAQAVPAVTFTGNVTVNGFADAQAGFTTATAVTAFENIAFTNTNKTIELTAAASNISFNNCVFEGEYVTVGASGVNRIGNVAFDGCTFNGTCISGYVDSLINVKNSVVTSADGGFLNNQNSGDIVVDNCTVNTGRYFVRTNGFNIDIEVTDSDITVYESEGTKHLVYFRGSNESAEFIDCTIADGWTTEGVDANSTLEIYDFYDVDGVTYVEDGLTKEKTLYLVPSDYEGTTVTVAEGTTTIGNYAFAYNSNVKEVVLASTVRDLGRGFDSSTVKRVVLNDGLTTISSRAFKSTTALEEVVIPSTVTEIADDAFQKTGLKTITIPATVKRVGSQAFGASQIETVIFEGNTTIENKAFRGCAALRTVNMNGDDITFVNTTGQANCWFCNSESNNPGTSTITFNVKNPVVAAKVKTAMGADITTITINCEAEVDEETGFWEDAEGNTCAQASNNTDLSNAISGGAETVYLSSGEYIIPASAKGKTLTIVGSGDAKVAVTKVGTGGENCDYGLDGSTVVFENITITTNSSTYIGYARCNATYNNCTINGTYTLYGDSVFNNCTFNVTGDVYNIWTWGAPTATFNNCTFNSDGKAVLLYGTANTKLTVDGCTFNDNGGLTDLKAAIEIGNDYGKSYELIVKNTTVNGYEINDKGINTGTTLWANKNSMDKDHLNVVVDGVDVY